MLALVQPVSIYFLATWILRVQSANPLWACSANTHQKSEIPHLPQKSLLKTCCQHVSGVSGCKSRPWVTNSFWWRKAGWVHCQAVQDLEPYPSGPMGGGATRMSDSFSAWKFLNTAGMKANHGGHSTNGTSKGELEHLPLWLHPAFKKRTLSFTSLRRNLNCAVKYSIARRIVERHAMSAPEAYPSLCFGCRHYRPMIPRTDCVVPLHSV